MSTTFKKRSPAMLGGLAVAAALVLAACGGSNHSGDPVAGGPGTDAPPIDPFIAAVQGQVSLSAETTTEPINIDNIAVTSNEDKEPIAI